MPGISISVGGKNAKSGSAYWTKQSLLEGESFDNGKVILQFDDAWDSVIDNGSPLFTEKGIKVTTFANGGLAGGLVPYHGFYYMTWAELRQLRSQGHDVQCHGYLGSNLTTLTDEQIQDEYVLNDNAFVLNGIPKPKHTAYSGGYSNYHTSVQTLLKRLSGRTTIGSGEITRYTSKSMMKQCSLNNETATIKEFLDTVCENKTAIILYGHMIGVDDPMSVSVEKLEELIDYAKLKGLDFITISDFYNQLFYIDINLYREGLADTEIGVVWNSKLDNTYRYSLERSTDGITFAEIFAGEAGVKSYLDSGLTLGTNYYYRVRAFKNNVYQAYSGVEYLSTPITMTITSVGTGAGVSTLIFAPSYDTTLTLNNNGYFYTDAAGTQGQSQSVSVYRDILTTLYIKCSSGSASLKINTNYIAKLEKWITSSNSPSLSGNISLFKRIYFLDILGVNNLTGSLGDLSNLTYLHLAATCTNLNRDITTLLKLGYCKTEIAGAGAAVSGSISNLTKLYWLEVSSGETLTGAVTNLVKLQKLSVPTTSNLSGSISNLTELVTLYSPGINSLSGSFTLLTKLTGIINVGNGNTLSGLISQIPSAVTVVFIGTGSTLSGEISSLSANILTASFSSTLNTITGTVLQIPRQITYLNLGGNSLSGNIADLPVNITFCYIHGLNTITGDLSVIPLSCAGISLRGRNTINAYTYPHAWGGLDTFYYFPFGTAITLLMETNLIIDLAAATWTGSKVIYFNTPVPSLADTSQGGIWGNFSGAATPSALATALKTLIKTKLVTMTLVGIAIPGASGDGTGFPAGFGNWWRS
jgi:peptidoglycan/xylan/chitin deacetylase (PgdA/CDA1 family)